MEISSTLLPVFFPVLNNLATRFFSSTRHTILVHWPAFLLRFIYAHMDAIVKLPAACSAMCSRFKKPLNFVALGNPIGFLPISYRFMALRNRQARRLPSDIRHFFILSGDKIVCNVCKQVSLRSQHFRFLN